MTLSDLIARVEAATGETRKAIRLFGVWKVLYWRFLYQRHMRLFHRFGWCKMEPVAMDPMRMFWCHWCGMRGEKHVARPEDAARMVQQQGEQT